MTAREKPDVALVGLGESSLHALELISEIVREAARPVIAILHAGDPAYIHEAAKRGVFAYIIDGARSRCSVRRLDPGGCKAMGVTDRSRAAAGVETLLGRTNVMPVPVRPVLPTRWT